MIMTQTVLPPFPLLAGHPCDGADFLMFDNFPGEVSAVGSLYSRTDSGPGPRLYVKESTGWVAK
jgi:hypothetical protein